MAGTTETDSIFRDFGNLPQLADTAVQLVYTDSLCALAAETMYDSSGVGSATDSTWLIRVGSIRYVAFNKKHYTAGRAYGFVLDSSFNYVASLLF